jgi:hypothetical protein
MKKTAFTMATRDGAGPINDEAAAYRQALMRSSAEKILFGSTEYKLVDLPKSEYVTYGGGGIYARILVDGVVGELPLSPLFELFNREDYVKRELRFLGLKLVVKDNAVDMLAVRIKRAEGMPWRFFRLRKSSESEGNAYLSLASEVFP